MTAATRKQAGIPLGQKQPSMAIASDLSLALDLAENFKPDVDVIVTEGIVTFGVKNSGKSNLCALLFEQVARYPIPMVLWDTKGEYLSLVEDGYAVLATVNTCPSGHDVLTKRLRVVVDLRSWDTDEAAALAMSQLLRELFAYASAQDDPTLRIPCPLLLDEAQYWLPQQAVSYLSKETARELRDAWHVIGTRGRSFGLISNYFTQNISEFNKAVMRQNGVYILMRQTLDNDLDRYLEYIRHASAAKVKNMIRAFAPGQAVIVLPNGEQLHVTFNQRRSEHLSHTPTVRDVLQRQVSPLDSAK
jgi:hypothetical protein